MMAWKFLKFYWEAVNRYRLDSPFLYRFVNEVLEGNQKPPYWSDFKLVRAKLLRDNSKIQLRPLGAGSKMISRAATSVAQVARSSLSSPKQQALLYRIVQAYQPSTMIELGTSFGLSALQQQAGNNEADFISIEGRLEVHDRARAIVAQFKPLPKKPLLWLGHFDHMLPQALQKLGSLDYLFIDGDHRYEAVIKYFQTCLPYLHEYSVVVVHDIYWSDGMQKAWRSIVELPEITAAIDLFHMGILFFRSNIREKLDVKLVPYLWKPWMIGLFRS